MSSAPAGPAGQSFIGARGVPAEYQRVSARDLRRKLDVYAPPPADLNGTALRPTLSGPSSGCPFLLDARVNPSFAGLDLDPERIQTKGCSFCLDNFGAYVVPKESEVVRAWIEGVRQIRAARPGGGLCEILLTDERPHPFLPAFFEAIEQEPGLGPVELLWKSRVDWLLEFAAEVERACQIAGRSGSVVHLYLVGFESFDRGHLELFNKGHGPEVNEAAIEKMRELAARYPDSFEHRRHRSHGILLFTPWTEPEALLENARWMRRLRFHELRSEAVKTRLRLYPRVPLHRLAERDGLLTERFDAGRGDRAAEQGYDASVPWRFRDGRTEAIFQLANALHRSDRTLTDADLIELATRYVLRWPGLAAVPGLAHLPLRAAIEAWGAPLAYLLARLGPEAAGFDPEIEAIGKTPKRAALKESVRAGDAEDMARAYRAMGFAAAVVVRHGMEKRSGAHHAGEDHAIVAVAADEATLAELLTAQRGLAGAGGRFAATAGGVPGAAARATSQDAAGRSTAGEAAAGRSTAHADAAGRSTAGEAAAGRSTAHADAAAPVLEAVPALGALMGYPACCAAAFAGLADRGDNLFNERLPFLRHPEAALHPLLHRTGVVRFVSHHLCAPDCAASAAQAERVLGLLGEASPDAAARLLAALRLPSLFLDYDRFASVEGAWHGDHFQLARVHASTRSREIEGMLANAVSVELASTAITVRFHDGSARTLAADHPLLAVPGEALAAPALRALRGSGAALDSGAAARQHKPEPASHEAVSGTHSGPRTPAIAEPHAAPGGHDVTALPAILALPAALRPGVRVAGYSVAAIDRGGGGCTVVLARGSERLAVRLRGHRDGVPYTLRRGGWAVDVDGAAGLGEAARAAIGLLVRALPRW